MTARWVGVLAVGASVLLFAGAALARETAGPARQREVTGTVIRSDAGTLYVEHMGAVIPIELGRDTRFFGVPSAGELASGQEVRASFTVKGDTKNLADTVSLVPLRPSRELWSWPDRSEDFGG